MAELEDMNKPAPCVGEKDSKDTKAALLPCATVLPSENAASGNEGPIDASSVRTNTVSAWKIYQRPAPMRTFPLPIFIPHNPLSLLHIVVMWLRHMLAPPPNEPSVIYRGEWRAELRGVVVQDSEAIRGLWEQGFWGKGSLSRSEPNWLKREETRRTTSREGVSEIITANRREDRRKFKWSRAKDELAALERQKKEESLASVNGLTKSLHLREIQPPVGPFQLLALPNTLPDLATVPPSTEDTDQQMERRCKSVKFPATLDPATVERSDARSPSKSAIVQPGIASATTDIGTEGDKSLRQPVLKSGSTQTDQPIVDNDANALINKEHYQLAPEEAFFLCFGIGALVVFDSKTKAPIPTEQLLTLFREHSYFPPRVSKALPLALQPCDPFLINYAVYHHYRSLGWVPRAGLKFGCDYLLYRRGPVFDHAEFAIVLIPSYSDPAWTALDHPKTHMAWSKLMGIVRVQANVLKSLILVYVDVPVPLALSQAMQSGGYAAALSLYKIREFPLRRWSANRNR